MRKAKPEGKSVASTREEELFQLELKVARRADELSRSSKSDRGRDAQLWNAAEREVLGRVVSAGGSRVGAAA